MLPGRRLCSTIWERGAQACWLGFGVARPETLPVCTCWARAVPPLLSVVNEFRGGTVTYLAHTSATTHAVSRTAVLARPWC